MQKNSYVLGAGMTGLTAGLVSGLPIFEAAPNPGGICSSYYIVPGTKKRLITPPDDGEAYRFESGGGHWIFGGDIKLKQLLNRFVKLKQYQRRSSVFFCEQDLYIPYPLQNHLRFLDKEVASHAIAQMMGHREPAKTMKDWLDNSFGGILCELFFYPFHELYTAGLYETIAPQDSYKSPVDLIKVIQGALSETNPVGYNTTFLYPIGGLNLLAQKIAKQCDIRYNKCVVGIEPKQKEIYFKDGSVVPYRALVSTLPLNDMLEMSGILCEAKPDPYSSVLVLNIGAGRGARCPNDHWLYNPDAKSGFHRVGFYSNVDTSFLPISARKDEDKVSIYVERAYSADAKPSNDSIVSYAQRVIEELQHWEFITDADIVDSTWIDVAYTWSWPDSMWRYNALEELQKYEIYQTGRYGEWIFQGIADSIRAGLLIGTAFKD